MSHRTLAVAALVAAPILPLAMTGRAEAAPTVVAHAAAPSTMAHRRHIAHLHHLHALHLRVAAARRAATSARAKVLAAARSALGRPYRYGAAGPAAFDCSGFIKWSYGAAGKDIPRTTAGQARAGHAVTRARPGDILVYSASSGPYHVALVTRVNSAGRVLMTEVARHTGTLISYQAPYQVYTVRAILT